MTISQEDPRRWWAGNSPVEGDIATLERLLMGKPDDVATRLILGRLHLADGNLDKAIAEFQTTRPFSAYAVLSYNFLALAFMCKPGRNSEDLALKQLQKGLETSGRQDEEYLPLRYNIARLMEMKGVYDVALEQYKLIVTIDISYLDTIERLQDLRGPDGGGGPQGLGAVLPRPPRGPAADAIGKAWPQLDEAG